MELKNIYELWDRFDLSNATEMELDYAGLHLKLKREVSGGVPVSVAAPMQTKEVSEEKKDVPKVSGTEVKAPLVGVFYRSPAPGEAPFVTEGATVAKGDVIGIIEAMKMMNEITTSESGIVDEILVEDGSMVEYDQTLLTLK